MPSDRPIRATAKRRPHPADDMPVDVFLDGYAPPIRALAQALREAVLAITPDATERVRVGWRIIGFDLPIRRHGAYFAWVFPEREHVHLGFPQGDRMAPRPGLDGEGITKRARWITYTPGERIDRRLVRELVLEAAALTGVPRGA
jgi:Domain of unknown function (DU1801)